MQGVMNDFMETIKQLTNGENSKVNAVGLVFGKDGHALSLDYKSACR